MPIRYSPRSRGAGSPGPAVEHCDRVSARSAPMSTEDRASRAAALADCLNMNLVSPAEVSAWVDEVIEIDPKPHWTFCELATMSTRSPQELAGVLNQVPG